MGTFLFRTCLQIKAMDCWHFYFECKKYLLTRRPDPDKNRDLYIINMFKQLGMSNGAQCNYEMLSKRAILLVCFVLTVTLIRYGHKTRL